MKKELYLEKKKIALFSVVLNFLLSIIKIIGGLISGSTVLYTDGIHSLSDFVSSLSVYVGILVSNKKTKIFQNGLYKLENLIALVSSFAIFFAAYEIAKDVLFADLEKINDLTLPLIILGITVLSTYLYSKWEYKKAIELNSPSLKADSQHVKADFYAALVVLIGIVAQYFNYIILEKIAVVIVIGFILHSGFEILKESLMVLLDASIDHETYLEINKILESDNRIKKINSIAGRNAGSYKFIELDLNLETDSLKEAHQIAHEIEKKIKESNEFIERVIIHYG